MKGYSWQDVRETIRDIGEYLNNYNIKIHVTNIVLENKAPDVSGIQIYKPNQNLYISLVHDLCAIEELKKIRGKYYKFFHEVNSFFLTADAGLVRYNFKSCKHEINGTIAETVLDRTLCALVWLQNPNKKFEKLPIWSFIAAHRTTFLLDKNTWSAFHKKLSDLIAQDKIEEPDILYLAYSEDMDELMNIKVEEIDEIR